MKQELIKALFEEFDNDKETIKNNLLQVMDTIILKAKDKYGSLTMTIHYERENEDGK